VERGQDETSRSQQRDCPLSLHYSNNKEPSVNRNVIRFGFVIPLSLFAIGCSSFLAMAADAPSVDTLKQVLDQKLQELRPDGFTEQPDGIYLDDFKKPAGAYKYDSAAGTILIRGGSLDGQVGKNARGRHFDLSETVSCESTI
jgi:hypothetical protein